MALMGTDKAGETEEVKIDHMGRLIVTHDDGMSIAVQTFRGLPLEVISATANTVLTAISVSTAAAAASLATFVTMFTNIYTALTQSIRTEEIDPASQWHINENVDVTDQADATYDYYYDFDGYSKGAFQLNLDCGLGTVTATFETSTENNVDPTAAAYQDRTAELFGVASLISAAAAAEDYWTDDTGVLGSVRWVRIRIVAATGGAAAQLGDWVINHKRLWV